MKIVMTDIWIVDSGASSNMRNDISGLRNLQEYTLKLKLEAENM